LFLGEINMENTTWARVPDGGLTPGQSGQLTVHHKISLTSVTKSRVSLFEKVIVIRELLQLRHGDSSGILRKQNVYSWMLLTYDYWRQSRPGRFSALEAASYKCPINPVTN
jgi:hypothetical protein